MSVQLPRLYFLDISGPFVSHHCCIDTCMAHAAHHQILHRMNVLLCCCHCGAAVLLPLRCCCAATVVQFTPAEWLGLSRWWCPSITFTGTSAYGFNPANGRINRHVDTWDSIQQQRFFSMEAFGDFWAQLLAPYLTPPLQSPRYTLLRHVWCFVACNRRSGHALIRSQSLHHNIDVDWLMSFRFICLAVPHPFLASPAVICLRPRAISELFLGPPRRDTFCC